MQSPAINIKNLSKLYQGRWGRPSVEALKNIDLLVENSSVCCVLGPNGAGKSTLISILCGLLLPNSGEGQVLGMDLLTQRRQIKSAINFTSGHANFPANFTLEEILTYFGMLYGLARKQRILKIDELLSFFELNDYRDVPFSHLSAGLKQRLALAKSMINDPKILFLDEPTVGLDPSVATLIRSRLEDWIKKNKRTVLLTTHQMDEAEQLSDKILFLKEGKIFRMGSATYLKDSILSKKRLIIHGERLGRCRESLTGVLQNNLIEIDNNRICIRSGRNVLNVNKILGIILDSGSCIHSVDSIEPTLGDVFIELAS